MREALERILELVEEARQFSSRSRYLMEYLGEIEKIATVELELQDRMGVANESATDDS